MDDGPQFIYDLDGIRTRAAQVHSLLGTALSYVPKANKQPGVLKALASICQYMSVMSLDEHETLEQLGFPSSHQIFIGPGKKYFSAMADGNIGLLSLESEREILSAEKAYAEAGKTGDVLLRVMTDSPAYLQAPGVADFRAFNKYGISLKLLPAAFDLLEHSSHLRLRGLHLYGVSGLTSGTDIADHLQRTFIDAEKVAERYGVPRNILLFGPGMGIRYSEPVAFDADRIRPYVLPLTSSFDTTIAECGTILTGDFGKYCAPIVDYKETGAALTLIVDGGIHHLLRPSLVSDHHTTIAETDYESQLREVQVAGNLCHPLDVLARSAVLPVAHDVKTMIGKHVVIHNCGAYGQEFAVTPFGASKAKTTYRGADAIGN